MATVCEKVKIDSNLTGLFLAEEICFKQLPTLALDGYDAVWFGLEPNSYSDFGGDNSSVARAPIDPSRQRKKGTIVDLDASGGYNTDVTRTNLTRPLQGFFFADARRKVSTEAYALGANNTVLTGVVGSAKNYTAAAGLAGFNKPGALLLAEGFNNVLNNGVKTIVSAAAGTVTVVQALADETPSANAKLTVVGHEFESAEVGITVVGGLPQLNSSDLDLQTLGLIPGEWIFIGGDALGNRFDAGNVGFARVLSISEDAIVFDDTTFAPIADAGAGKSIRVFFGTVIKNEKLPALIKRRSYNLERTLGVGPEAETPNDQQAEYLEGAVPNEFTLNMPQADKLNADLTFVAGDNTYRNGAAGAENKLKAGVRISAPGEDAINTSSDIYRVKMAINFPGTSTPTPLFGYLTEATVTINNGVTPNKALGILGAVDTSASDFQAGGSATVFFSSVAAVRAVRQNADVGLNVITASKNSGMVFDIPLLSLGGGRINVEKDAPITVPLEPSGAENKHGYTMLYVNFPYLPNVAMPN